MYICWSIVGLFHPECIENDVPRISVPQDE
jgi:hypothetical protein